MFRSHWTIIREHVVPSQSYHWPLIFTLHFGAAEAAPKFAFCVGPNILLNIFLPNTNNFCLMFSVKTQHSDPYTTTGIIRALIMQIKRVKFGGNEFSFFSNVKTAS